MEITNKLILIILLIIILIILLFKNNNEHFSNLNNNIFNKNKSKITKITKLNNKQDYYDLEVKILSSNTIYEKLNKYISKYNINFIYNLENLELNIPLVITYDNQSVKNNNNESFVNFLKGLNYYKYNFIVCGINTKWEGWYGRYKVYLELLELIPDNQLVFITDSRDVLVNDSPIEFEKNYNKIIKLYNDEKKNKIIFGTEIGCCVNQMWHFSPGTVFYDENKESISIIKNNIINDIIEEKKNLNNHLDLIEIDKNKSIYNSKPNYSLIKNENNFLNGKEFPWMHWIKWNNFFKEKFNEAMNKYKLNITDKNYPITKLNFGMMVGININVLKMLKLFNMKPGEDDQHLASEFFYMRPEMVILDYTQILLSNTGYKHSFRKCTSQTMNNNYYNVNFNDHLNKHDEYINMNVYTTEDIPEQGIMYGFDIQFLKYFFTYDNIISYPCFIQSPGKDWNCYNELLYKFPYCDDKMCSYYYNLEQTEKYNIRDIIIHEYKNQLGDMKIEWILTNLFNPLYWALILYIVKDIYDLIHNNIIDSNILILINSNNLLAYNRFNNSENQNILPWDDELNLDMYSKTKIEKDQLENFFKLIIKKGYDILIYYKELHTPYSLYEHDYYTIKINSENILQIQNLFLKYEIVLFNISISNLKYEEILKIFNMNFDYEEKYIGGTIKNPSINIFMYDFNNFAQSFEYNKIFGIGYPVSIPENYVLPYANFTYNNIQVKIPNNIENILKLFYEKIYNNKPINLNLITIKKHTNSINKENLINKINKLNLSIQDKNIVLIIKIYNNFINKYFEIINNNQTIKKIISIGK